MKLSDREKAQTLLKTRQGLRMRVRFLREKLALVEGQLRELGVELDDEEKEGRHVRRMVIVVTGEGISQSCIAENKEQARAALARMFYGDWPRTPTDKISENRRWCRFSNESLWSVDQDGLPFEYSDEMQEGGYLRAFTITEDPDGRTIR